MAISTTGWKGIAALGFTAAAFAMLMGSSESPKEASKAKVKVSGAKKPDQAVKTSDPKHKEPEAKEDHGSDTDEHQDDPKHEDPKHEDPKHEDPKADDHNAPESEDEGSEKKHADFVVSSHTNFNVVPHGVIKFGGKGKPGDKVMVSVDGKPSMKGTIKENGRWTFDIKINSPGGRTLKADNLSTKESKVVKLKIK